MLSAFQGDRWGSNPRQPEPQSGALPAELRPPFKRAQRKYLSAVFARFFFAIRFLYCFLYFAP